MIRQLTVHELKERLDEGKKDFTLLDVREPWELNICSMPDAISVPMRAIPARYPEFPKDQEIVVVCHHGVRSQQVAYFLERQGFTRLNNLVGGVNAWAHEIDPKMPTY
jgi:rhodanese-related sulfurtransferase